MDTQNTMLTELLCANLTSCDKCIQGAFRTGSQSIKKVIRVVAIHQHEHSFHLGNSRKRKKNSIFSGTFNNSLSDVITSIVIAGKVLKFVVGKYFLRKIASWDC